MLLGAQLTWPSLLEVRCRRDVEVQMKHVVWIILRFDVTQTRKFALAECADNLRLLVSTQEIVVLLACKNVAERF